MTGIAGDTKLKPTHAVYYRLLFAEHPLPSSQEEKSSSSTAKLYAPQSSRAAPDASANRIKIQHYVN